MVQLNRAVDFQQFSSGRLFCFCVKNNNSQADNAVIIVPPFAEEMNKSRKMMSMLLDEVADDSKAGYLFDLYGTGDSAGDFSRATWDVWCQNLIDIISFVATQSNTKNISFVAIRTGALLLNHVLADNPLPIVKIKSIHYWNPVFNATLFVNQFLRLKLAANMMRNNEANVTVKNLRHELDKNGQLEVAGYTLNSSLVQGMQAAKIVLHERFNQVPMHFYELSAKAQITPGLMKKIAELQHNDDCIFTHALNGAQFWNTQEIAICKPLIALTKANLDA